MLAPLSWLREFTPYEGTAEALGQKLTMLGLELEEIINPFAGLADIKVGFVSQCAMHPDSDHLRCCKVDLGGPELVDIVCGAPNVAQGQKVAVAPVGATLPDGTRIKKAKLRGQPSNGMICSERELGLSEDHSGIMVLPESADVGHSLIAALDLDTEVLNLSITPNRGDCLSILGIARETAAAFGLPLYVPDLPLIIDHDNPPLETPVEIRDSSLCWLYAGRVITNARAGQAPMRMRYRLHAVGVRAISNIVDVTNYILFEVGQPLHAFDLDKLDGKRIIVRQAKPDEMLVTLDGKERKLLPTDLCICDATGPVALAGVMGGQNSEITAETSNVFIESAVFQPQSIRRTSRRLGLQSEASYRFERGIDQCRSVWALDRACALMARISGGYVRSGFSLAEPRPFTPARIAYAPGAADALLGVQLDAEFQAKTLAALGCAVENRAAASWTVIQPSWRHDLTREADLIEETGRVYGLDRIEPVLPSVRRSLADNLKSDTVWDFIQLVKRWGAGAGLYEAINYSFVGQKELDLLNQPESLRIAIVNPLSEEQNALRTCLSPGLLRDLANNLAFGTSSIRLFEIANAFARDEEAETGASETPLLGILLSGLRHMQQWPHREADLDYADLKGLVENLFAFLHLEKPGVRLAQEPAWLAPCVAISCAKGDCGFMGRVKPEIAKAYNAQKAVWLCELDLTLLQLLHAERIVQFAALPVYPAVRRDITVTVPAGINSDQILEKLLLMKLPLLEGAVLLDSYTAEGSDERSLTYRLTFRNPARTLKDEEADKEREKIAAQLRSGLGARI